MPHLIVTAGNDQHLRIWDVRHLSHLNPRTTEILTPPPSANGKNGDPLKGESDFGPHTNTRPTSSIGNEKVYNYMHSNKGKGLLRASFQHGKSCSAAYWDPWGRRILTTSYDDKLRGATSPALERAELIDCAVWTTDPSSFGSDAPLAAGQFQPSRIIPHNCQTGRWLTILRAQWSLNMDYIPHFTVGNMKRSLDVVACTGDKIVNLWTDV